MPLGVETPDQICTHRQRFIQQLSGAGADHQSGLREGNDLDVDHLRQLVGRLEYPEL